ncbi:MAG: DUF4167 domain-containing protein [Alphaproteobacteria bacterium]|nr:DUF4167 domain-containing protein [Alphaproteobacteria bacterium]
MIRQNQQNSKRGGRSRKVVGGLNRVYESNGPDVKIRGTASHIAEKYTALARDAHVSGDPVIAENYMQHAEHYSRFIAAIQAQQQSQNSSPPYLEEGGEAPTCVAGGDGETAQPDPVQLDASQSGPRQQNPRYHGPRQQSPRQSGPGRVRRFRNREEEKEGTESCPPFPAVEG